MATLNKNSINQARRDDLARQRSNREAKITGARRSAYARGDAREVARADSTQRGTKRSYNQPTYTTDGGTRTYDTATGKLLSKTVSPTVLTDANIRENVIPDLNQRAANMMGLPSPYAPTALPSDQAAGTGTGAGASTPKAPTTTSVTGTPDLQEEMSKLFGSTTTDKAETSPLDDEYARLREEMFQGMEREVSNKAKKDEARVQELYARQYRDMGILQQQAEAQKASLGSALFSSGASRYGSVSGGGLVTATERELMNNLSDLRIDEQKALDDVREAQKEGNWRVMEARLNYAEKVRAEREKRRDELMKEIRERNKTSQEKIIQATRDNAVANLLQEGISDPAQLLDYLNYDDAGNQIGDFTAEELKKTMDNLAASAGGEELRTVGSSLVSVGKDGKVKILYTAPTAAQLNAAGGITPGSSDYNQSILVARLGKSIYGTRISDAESERVQGFVTSGMGLGKGENEIIDDVLGYQIAPNANKPLADALKNTLLATTGEDGLAGFDMLGLARLINSGQEQAAVQKVENFKMQEAQNLIGADTFVTESDVKYVSDKVDELTQLLGEGWSNEVGAFSGSMSAFIDRKFGGLFGGEATKIKAKVTSLISSLANKRGGSAITDEEWDRLIAPNVPAMNESAKAWTDKMDELVSDPLTRLNAERQMVFLPSLAKGHVRNPASKSQLYSLLTPTGSAQALKQDLDSLELPDEDFWGQ